MKKNTFLMLGTSGLLGVSAFALTCCGEKNIAKAKEKRDVLKFEKGVERRVDIVSDMTSSKYTKVFNLDTVYYKHGYLVYEGTSSDGRKAKYYMDIKKAPKERALGSVVRFIAVTR